MLANREGKILLGVAALVLVVAVVAAVSSSQPKPALAQMPPAMGEPTEEMPPPGVRPPEPRIPPRPEMPWRPPPAFDRGMYEGGSVAIATTQDYVYVVKGNTLYQFSARNLRFLKKAELAASRWGSPVVPQAPPRSVPPPPAPPATPR